MDDKIYTDELKKIIFNIQDTKKVDDIKEIENMNVAQLKIIIYMYQETTNCMIEFIETYL